MRRFFVATLALVAAVPEAQAMTAGDFLDRLNDQQQVAYIEGALDMLATEQGNGAGYDWYFRGPGPQQLAAVLVKHRDLPVTSIIEALVKRQTAK